MTLKMKGDAPEVQILTQIPFNLNLKLATNVKVARVIILQCLNSHCLGFDVVCHW